jgi:hypothetical protein
VGALSTFIIIRVCQLDYFMYVRSLICIDECIGKIVLTTLSENANISFYKVQPAGRFI